MAVLPVITLHLEILGMAKLSLIRKCILGQEKGIIIQDYDNGEESMFLR